MGKLSERAHSSLGGKLMLIRAAEAVNVVDVVKLHAESETAPAGTFCFLSLRL